MVNSLKIIFSVVLVWMIYIVVSTSLESNLFDEWDYLGSIPWMRATLWDFYANVLLIYFWVLYREKTIFSKVIWLILVVTLGSIASCLYVLIALFRLKPGEKVSALFTRY